MQYLTVTNDAMIMAGIWKSRIWTTVNLAQKGIRNFLLLDKNPGIYGNYSVMNKIEFYGTVSKNLFCVKYDSLDGENSHQYPIDVIV